MNTPTNHEATPNNRLDKAFSQYVSDAYENNEFDLPEPELVGDTADHIDSEGELGFTVIRRQLGDAAVTEILSGNGHNNTSINDGELTLQETPRQSLVLEKGQNAKVTTDAGNLDIVPDDASIPASAFFENPTVQRAIDAASNIVQEDDTKKEY